MAFSFQDPGSSFFDYLKSQSSNLQFQPPIEKTLESHGLWESVPHGTTILAFRSRNGVVIAGDRMATEGYSVSARKLDKVFKTDDYSAIAISGAAGPSMEMARLFQTELEHYEKIEGTSLSTDGKANKLSQMIKSNLPMAFQGLVVIPIFVGYDLQEKLGRIFKYDVTGGRYEETEYFSTGSGGRDARNTLKFRYKANLNEKESIQIAVEALFNASEEDVGTGGPDPIRGIYPSIKIIDQEGLKDVGEPAVKEAYEKLIEKRKEGV